MKKQVRFRICLSVFTLLLAFLFILPGAAFSADKIKIKLAHTVPTSHAYHKGYVKFKNLVAERTDGQVEVTIFPQGTLGGDIQAADSVQMGIAQMALTGTFALYDYNPKWAREHYPFFTQT